MTSLAFVDISANLGGQIATKPQFYGREEAFSSQIRQILKRPYYQNYSIDYNQILLSNRDPQVIYVGGPTLPQTNPRWRTAAILKNRKMAISNN